MPATVGDIAVRVGVDISSLVGGMKTAGRSVDTFGDKLGINAKNAAVWGAATAAAAAAAAGAIALLTRQGLSFIDSQAKAARSIDATIDGLRAVTLAGEEAGVSTESMVSSMQLLSRNLADAAAESGPAADALKELGMSADELSSMDADDRLAAIADRAKELGLSSGETSRLLQGLGIRSKEMAAFVAAGGDAIREAGDAVQAFGLSVSEDVAARVEAANDAVGRMGLIMESLRNQLAAQVAPALLVMAQRFTEMAQAGGQLQDGVSLIAEAVGNLATSISDPAFADAAVIIGVNLLKAVTSLADGMVWLSQNINTAALAVGALGIALAVLGGPLGLAVRLAAGAASAYLLMGDHSKNAEDGAYNVAAAEAALNGQLAEFATSTSPAAREESRKRVISLKEQATAALAAAEAELAVRQAMKASAEAQFPGSGAGIIGDMDTKLAKDEIAAITAQIREMTAALKDMDASGGGSGGVVPGTLPAPTLPGRPDFGGGGGGGIADVMAQRLETLTTSLQTEREIVEIWYQEGLELIAAASEEELAAVGGKHAALERLEEEHQSRLAAIRDIANQGALSATLGAADTILSAVGAFNDKAFKMAKVAGAAQALISTYQGAAEALKLPFPKNLAAAAAVMAKGLGFVAAIKSVNSKGGGGSGGGRGGSGGGSSAAAAPVQQPTQTMNFTIQNDPFGFGEKFARDLVAQLNAAQRNGSTIVGTVS